MPGYLVNGHRDEPVPIPGTDRTVTFKSMASYGDDLHCDVVRAQFGAPAGMTLSADEERHTAQQRTRAYVLARTCTMIAAWDLVDVEGRPLPITPASLESLTVPVGEFLAIEARKRFEGRPPEEEPPFSKPSRRPSTPEAASTRR